MSAEQAPESFLVAECGRVLTRAVLVEAVDDACRYVAQGTSPSTIELPVTDLGVGLRGALGALEGLAARRCLTASGDILLPRAANGDGADLFLATAAVAPPSRLAILAGDDEPALAALLDVARRTPTTVLPLVTVDRAGRLDEGAPLGSGALEVELPAGERLLVPLANVEVVQ